MIPVSKYLPELTRAREVTIRMLLSHTSGYQDYWPEDYVMTSMMVPTTAQHILDVWGKRPLDFDPGTQWQYSNTNYVIAGRIVEQVSGMALIDLLKKRIFLPLGMDNVYDSDASRLPATDPTGYERHALGPQRAFAPGGRRVDVCCRGASHAGPRPGALGHQRDRSFAARPRRLMRRCSPLSCSKMAPTPVTAWEWMWASAMATTSLSTRGKSRALSRKTWCSPTTGRPSSCSPMKWPPRLRA